MLSNPTLSDIQEPSKNASLVSLVILTADKGLVMSKLLTVRDVAAVLQCSEDAVVRRFAKLPGAS